MKRMNVALAALAGLALTAGAAEARDQIHIVGSSTVFPFTTAVAESFGKGGKFKTPVVESTGTGGGGAAKERRAREARRSRRNGGLFHRRCARARQASVAICVP